MPLRIDQIISLVEYFEDFVEAKAVVINRGHERGFSQAELNQKRTSVVDYIEELFGKDKSDDAS